MTDTLAGLDADGQEVLRLHREFVAANGPLDSAHLRERAVAGEGELVWFNLNGSNYIGLEHIAGLWDTLAEKQAGQPSISTELKEEQVHVIGDVAWVTYLNHYAGDYADMGSYDAGMRGTEVWRRDESTWRLAHTHFSPHTPGQMGGV